MILNNENNTKGIFSVVLKEATLKRVPHSWTCTSYFLDINNVVKSLVGEASENLPALKNEESQQAYYYQPTPRVLMQ
jgi:hypothetical protein